MTKKNENLSEAPEEDAPADAKNATEEEVTTEPELSELEKAQNWS